jgi:hypothetical protein
MPLCDSRTHCRAKFFVHAVFRDIRNDAALLPCEEISLRFDKLGQDVRGDFLQDFGSLAERHNPIVRRVVRRTRPMLEQSGLLKRIGVISHPAISAAYEAAEAFNRLYAARCPRCGFLKTRPAPANWIVSQGRYGNRSAYPWSYRRFNSARGRSW